MLYRDTHPHIISLSYTICASTTCNCLHVIFLPSFTYGPKPTITSAARLSQTHVTRHTRSRSLSSARWCSAPRVEVLTAKTLQKINRCLGVCTHACLLMFMNTIRVKIFLSLCVVSYRYGSSRKRHC